jgi:hypothetical protein
MFYPYTAAYDGYYGAWSTYDNRTGTYRGRATSYEAAMLLAIRFNSEEATR